MSDWFGDDDDDRQQTTSPVVSNKEPQSSQQPYILAAYDKAQELFGSPRQYAGGYEGSTVVPRSEETIAALQGIKDRAIAGSNLVTAAQDLTKGTLAGDYMDPSKNAYLTSAMDAATRPMRESFTQDVLPGVDAAFSSGGRYGSGLQANQQARLTDTYLQNLGDIGAKMAYQNYGDERQRQVAAADVAPAMAQLDYLDLERLGTVGAAEEALAAQKMQEDIDKLTFSQEEERQRLAEFLPQVTGGQYTTSSTTTPLYSDRTSSYLGYGAQAADIVGSLFGGGKDSAFNTFKGFF